MQFKSYILPKRRGQDTVFLTSAFLQDPHSGYVDSKTVTKEIFSKEEDAVAFVAKRHEALHAETDEGLRDQVASLTDQVEKLSKKSKKGDD